MSYSSRKFNLGDVFYGGHSIFSPSFINQSKSRDALQKPLYQRCEEIEKLIEGSSTQNLHGFFPQLLNNIFGYSGSTDWGLKTLSRESREFDFVRRFLSPTGAVFKLIDMLQADDLHRYEFFISCLPFPTQNSLSDGMIPVFYHDKIPARTGEARNAVLLNAFEYYMFHFAYYIVHQETNRESSLTAPQDFLYLFVLEDYLNFFLPCDGSSILPSNLKAKSSIGSIRKPSSWHDASSYTRTQYFQNQFKGLIKPSSGRVSPPTTHHGVLDHTSQEIWRSEIFIQVLIEFWLNQSTIGSFSSNVLSHRQEYFMPSLDHVRVVRLLVKHVHSFVYVKTPDLNQLPILHSSDELRREIIPQFLQKKLYYFLRHCFSHWPLDSSFRYVLETWLSYIQPWRYSKHHQDGFTASGSEESRETASPQWKSFIFDNLLFYSALLFEFVSRACRFNLSSVKDAHLLFRVVKVFAQSHLVDMIEEGENAFLAPSGNHWSATQTNLTASSSAIKAHIIELEGPSYSFKSVFQQPGATKMAELHSRVLSALDEANSNSQAAQEPEESTGGIIGLLTNIFNSSSTQGNEFDRKTEEGKLVSNLKQTSELLTRIVRNADSIDASLLNNTIQWETTSTISGRRHSTLPGSQTSLPDHVETDRGLVPTPLGRYQMMNGLRKFEVKYSGDPELQPICSFENPALVRLFYKLSTHLNKKFGKSLDNMYTNSRIFRSVACLMSPGLKSASSATPGRQSSTSPVQSPQHLQISLRFLASYRTLIYLFIFWLFCKMTSMSTVLVILLWILVLSAMALCHLTSRREKSLIYSR